MSLPGGRPVPGAAIHSYPEILGSHLLSEFVAHAVTDSEGNFTLTHLVSGIPIRIGASHRPASGGKIMYAKGYAVAGEDDFRLELSN